MTLDELEEIFKDLTEEQRDYLADFFFARFSWRGGL